MSHKPNGSCTRLAHEGWVTTYDQVERHGQWITGEYSYMVLSPESRDTKAKLDGWSFHFP